MAGKSTTSGRFEMRVPLPLLERLTRAAGIHGQSVAAYLIQAAVERLDRDEGLAAPVASPPPIPAGGGLAVSVGRARVATPAVIAERARRMAAPSAQTATPAEKPKGIVASLSTELERFTG